MEIEANLWLFDTGAPTSFGEAKDITIAGMQFPINQSYMGISAAALSKFVGVECRGILAADILGCFDHIIDCVNGALSISTAVLEHSGQVLHLSMFMGIPTIVVQVRDTEYRMFFDTGGQFSYFQDDSLADFPAAGIVTDFFPGVGEFNTDTHEVEIALGSDTFTLRCGRLPGLLGSTLMMTGIKGIIGNQLLAERVIGYFPRRNILCL